ncbi:MAG: DUF1064 domain-containing protein [Oscillospiraceae bacterium]|nr:DUF1064 domain-containing protein [Oscillospiraceae bacterium]MBR6595180.1 DUF1064 domain-containing protein [Oscillospiraceae bacterium]
MGGLVFESINDLPPKMRQQVAVKILANVKPKPPSGEQKAVKYRNIKVEANGHTFDSKKEYLRYCALMDALREGVIYDLRLQQNFTLIEGYTKPDGERIQPMIYKADFTYRVSGPLHSVPTGVSLEDLEYWAKAGANALIIEDVKTKGTRTQVYINKYKMMAEKGYTIREV